MAGSLSKSLGNAGRFTVLLRDAIHRDSGSQGVAKKTSKEGAFVLRKCAVSTLPMIIVVVAVVG